MALYPLLSENILKFKFKQFLQVPLIIISKGESIMGRTKIQKTPVAKTPRKTKKVQKACKEAVMDNKISIKKLANQKEVVAEFSLIRNEKGAQVMAIPVYRKDKLDFTPGFSLPDEFTKSFVNQQQALQEYRMSSETTMIDAENIKQPKPSSRNSYCTMCKVRFQDYKEHIELDIHLAKMRGSIYNKYIQELCQKKKIQRFFTTTCSRELETAAQERTEDLLRIFLEDQQPHNYEVKCFSNTKESLYQKIRGEIKLNNPVSPTNDDIFNVLMA